MTSPASHAVPHIIATRQIPEEAYRLLDRTGKVHQPPGIETWPPEKLKSILKTAVALICFPGDRIDEEIIASGPRLKVIACGSASFGNVDTSYAQACGIWVTNTPDIMTDATADLAFGLLLSAARHIVAADRFLRQGNFRGWDYFLFHGVQLSGKVLGIVGMGRIGQAVAERAKGFGLKILYSNRMKLTAERERELGARYVSFGQLLRRSDFISLHVPLTSTTHHLIGTPQLEVMKKGAILINTSRGGVVSEKALAWALKTGRIAAAGLDVYEQETSLERELLDLDNVILLPHIGSATEEARRETAMAVVRDVLSVLRGKRPRHPVVVPEKP